MVGKISKVFTSSSIPLSKCLKAFTLFRPRTRSRSSKSRSNTKNSSPSSSSSFSSYDHCSSTGADADESSLFVNPPSILSLSFESLSLEQGNEKRILAWRDAVASEIAASSSQKRSSAEYSEQIDSTVLLTAQKQRSCSSFSSSQGPELSHDPVLRARLRKYNFPPLAPKHSQRLDASDIKYADEVIIDRVLWPPRPRLRNAGDESQSTSYYSLEEIWAHANPLPTLILDRRDLIGPSRLIPKHDGFFYYDPEGTAIADAVDSRGVNINRWNSPILRGKKDDEEFREAKAVRVYIKIPDWLLPREVAVDGKNDGTCRGEPKQKQSGEVEKEVDEDVKKKRFEYLGECFLVKTGRTLGRKEWLKIAKEDRDEIIQHTCKSLVSTPQDPVPRSPFKEKNVQRFYDGGGVFPLVVLRQVSRPHEEDNEEEERETGKESGSSFCKNYGSVKQSPVYPFESFIRVPSRLSSAYNVYIDRNVTADTSGSDKQPSDFFPSFANDTGNTSHDLDPPNQEPLFPVPKPHIQRRPLQILINNLPITTLPYPFPPPARSGPGFGGQAQGGLDTLSPLSACSRLSMSVSPASASSSPLAVECQPPSSVLEYDASFPFGPSHSTLSLASPVQRISRPLPKTSAPAYTMITGDEMAELRTIPSLASSPAERTPSGHLEFGVLPHNLDLAYQAGLLDTPYDSKFSPQTLALSAFSATSPDSQRPPTPMAQPPALPKPRSISPAFLSPYVPSPPTSPSSEPQLVLPPNFYATMETIDQKSCLLLRAQLAKMDAERWHDGMVCWNAMLGVVKTHSGFRGLLCWVEGDGLLAGEGSRVAFGPDLVNEEAASVGLMQRQATEVSAASTANMTAASDPFRDVVGCADLSQDERKRRRRGGVYAEFPCTDVGALEEQYAKEEYCAEMVRYFEKMGLGYGPGAGVGGGNDGGEAY